MLSYDTIWLGAPANTNSVEEQRCAKSESRFKPGTSPAKGQRSPLTSAVVLECPRAGDGNRFANTVPVSIGESDAIREQEDESLSQIETAAR